MASDNEASCASDPNFAVICSFLGCFGKSCGIVYPDIARLQEMLENSQEVSQQLIDLHIKLLRKTRKSVSAEKWERALVKFCHTYSNQDGWELERFGYKKARIAVKLRLLKVLLETQFDLNQKFKNEVNKLAADELRVEPLGRDKSGLAYWCQLDEECNIRVYREDIDEENWELVAKDREGVVSLINTLSNGEAGAIPINEDSNSLEISEKPIIDTGQVTTSPSLEDEVAQENGVNVDEINDKQLANGKSDEFEDQQEQDRDQDQNQDQDDITNEGENDEEDIDAEEDITNDESSKQITEEDDSQEMVQTQSIESRYTNTSSLLTTNIKMTAKVDTIPEETSHKEATDETSISLALENKSVVMHKPTTLAISGIAKPEIEESVPLKSIETPVITSPLKLINIAELKQTQEEKSVNNTITSPTTPIATILNVVKKHLPDDTIDSIKSLEKLSGKNNLSYSSVDPISVSHNKLAMKPIDQLAANLVRIQSEKLEKPSGPKSLEKIAESLARSGGILGSIVNGEDDRLPQDFCARNQSDKSATLRGHRGMDLSTLPRNWENANEQNRPMDFSGIDLSSRKVGKTIDLPSPGYRAQEFQHREMDLSTKKVNKPEVPNLPYDARSMMMRNHAMVADLSKRQMSFNAYEMPTAYHNAARLSTKDDHRLPSYTILPDPSKITTLRMNTASLKRPLEGDDAQQDMLKRVRTEVIPIRGSMDKRPIMGNNWREEVGEAIEEPLMMIQGEGSGSDCDAVNPIVGEAIEEPTIFFYGEGSGADCETGNPDDDASNDNKESNESKNESDSAIATLSQNKVLTEDEVSTDSIVSNKTPVKLNSNCQQSNVSINDNCQIVDSMQEKPKFKPTLGIQIIPKSTTGPVKRMSRWDVGKPEEKVESNVNIISNEGNISLKENRNDYKTNKAEQLLSTDTALPKTEDSLVLDQDVKIAENSVIIENETMENSIRSQEPSENLENISTVEQEKKENSKIQELIQCDSSISSVSLCQTDISQKLESCTNVESIIDSANIQSTSNSSSIFSHESDTFEIVENECKPIATSPPRFFFGPNCISYTSKSDELEESSKQSLTATVHNKIDTVQYECVSSSKTVDDTVYSYKTEDFDPTQTNNNSLKMNEFTSETEANSQIINNKDTETIEGPSNTWDQQNSAKLTSEDLSSISECNVTNSSTIQIQIEENTELSVRESVFTSEEVNEDNCSKLNINSVSEIVAKNESINDISMSVTEEESTEVSLAIEHSMIKEEESETVRSAQCDQSVDSAKLTNTENLESALETSDVTSPQLSDENTSNEKPAGEYCKNEEDDQSSNTGIFKETESVTTAHSSLSSLTQNSQPELADLREFEDGNNSNELLDSNSVGCMNYQEVNRSTEHNTDHVPEKYQILQKNDLDSVGESCDKQSDKNDNLSEIDGQEDHSTDTDNEKIKSLTGSDVDSMCVNYDKNSERIDALSDMGMQDEGSGDSEEIKEKGLNDVQLNNTVYDINSEIHFTEDSAVTTLESTEQNSEKYIPIPTSSDNACAQDCISQENASVQIDNEKTENTSSVVDKPSTLNILPSETNIFGLCKSPIVEPTKEENLPNIVQPVNEYIDNVSENPSSCIDQDSNEDMVIDDHVSESIESSKEIEEIAKNNKQQEDAVHEIPIECGKEEDLVVSTETDSCQITTETNILEKEIDVASESNNVKEFSENDNNKMCENDTQDTIVTEDSEISKSKETAEIVEGTEIDTVTVQEPETDIAPVQASEIDIKDTTSQKQEEVAVVDNKQSLVANYDSGDSNDGSDDVFEPDVEQIYDSKDHEKQTYDSKDGAIPAIEQETSEELHEKSEIVKPDEFNSTNSVSEVPISDEQSSTEQQLEKSLEIKVDEVLNEECATEKDVEISTPECVDEIQTTSDNSIEYHSNEAESMKLSNKNEFQEKTDTYDIPVSDYSTTSEASVVVKPMIEETNEVTPMIEGTNEVTPMIEETNEVMPMIEETNEIMPMIEETNEVTPIIEKTNSENENSGAVISHSEKSIEHSDNLIEGMKTAQSAIEVVEKTDHLIPEKDRDFNEDSTNNFEKVSFIHESTECNDINNQMSSILHVKEHHVKNVNEKFNTDLNTENNASLKDVNECISEKLPVTQSHKELKEDFADGNEDNKCDAKLHEECLTKPFTEEINSPIRTESDIILPKLENALITNKSETWKTESASSEGNVSSDILYFPNSIPTKMENINNVDDCSNQNDSFDIKVNVNKITEKFNRSPSSGMNEKSETTSIQEIISEVAVKSDFKKEASKRMSDASNIEDVPPLKSKPPCLEASDKILQNLVNVEIQAPTVLNTLNEVEKVMPKVENEEKLSAISTTQLFQNDFGTINDSDAMMLVGDSKKIELEIKEKKEPLETQNVEMKTVDLDSDDSMGVDNENVFNVPSEEVDPLACPDDDALKKITEDVSDTSKITVRVKSSSDITYEGWKLDSTTEIPKVSRKRRNSAQESNFEDGTVRQEEDEMTGGKRMKLRGKRMSDKELRRSVEENRVTVASSEDEAVKCATDNVTEHVKDSNDDMTMIRSITVDKKARGRPRGRRKRGFRASGRSNRSKFQGTQVPGMSPDVHTDRTPNDALSISTQKKRKKRKMVLGLEVGRDIVPEVESGAGQDETPVRQSRRIAQLKIKEQADRRRIEEETMRELGEKKESEKKKRKKQKPESEEEVIIKEIEKEKKSKKKRKKRKKKKMLAKFNEANPWQSSSGSSSDEENENEDEEEEDEDIESEGSLLFKSDHEFSPESDLEKDQESEPLRRARTAQKAQSDVEEAEDEYACQKCGKADHPEWILLCDSCDKGWHCSCLRPALMLIPEGDWFCPPCQHNLLVNKLRESLKTFDQLTKRHENEVLRKKRLAFVGISLDNVLHKGETQHTPKDSKASSQESDNESTSSSSASTSETSSSEESEPVYQLRERRCANTYKFNDYDDMINAAIQDEVEAVQGAGNQGRGKDIATIVNAEKEEAQAEALKMTQLEEEDKDDIERKSEKESDEEYKMENEDMMDEMEEEPNRVDKRLLARKKHRKLNSLDISSEDDPESDEDFKGSSSEEEEDFDDHMTSSDDSFVDIKRRGRKGDSRPVRRSTRARMTRAYDDDFINDDSDESDRPKRKKSRSWGDSDSEDSDNSWRQRKKKSKTMSTSRIRAIPKLKGKKKKKRKRIIESDNQSENDEEDEMKIEEKCEPNLQEIDTSGLNEMLDVNKQETFENNMDENNIEMKDDRLHEITSEMRMPQIPQTQEIMSVQKIKKDIIPKPKKMPTIRRKIIYGGLPDENRQEEEEILSRRTRGRKINYREEMASDSEEELKKALMMRKAGESEDEYVVNEADDMNDDAEKDSDSGDVYIPKKDALKFKNRSPKAKKTKNGKGFGIKRKNLCDETPKQRKKPGPKPGSKNKARKQKLMFDDMKRDDADEDMIGSVMDNSIGDIASKMDENLPDNVGLTGTTIASTFVGDVPETSLTGLGPGELADLDDEQLEQMMMEDEEYGRRQLELAAIEIAKKKKKEEREAKKLEKARLKALEILAAERQRDPNAPEGTDGEVPKKKKRGRRSKAEIIAEQMRRDGAPTLGLGNMGNPAVGISPDGTSNVSHNINLPLPTVLTPETDRSAEGGHIPLITGPDGQLFNPDGSPMKPKRRGRGKGKKTLALEAARAAEAAAKAAAEAGLIGMGTDSNPEMKQNDIPNVLPTPGSSTSGSAPSTPPASAVPTPGPPSTQPSNSQPVYPSLPPSQQSSVITRMLQSQPVSSSPQSFTAAAAAMGHKYFGGPNAGGQMMGGPRTGYEMQPRARIPSPYRQAGQATMPPHFAAVRSGTPPMRIRVAGPQMYHTTHHPMDPSPSGGGPISINNRDRSSPLTSGSAMIPPSAGSPLAKGGPTPPPPPPPYVRGGPPMARFAENPMGARHQMPPFTNASPVNMQQPSPPPNRPPGNFSPYHPPPPPNYHYGAYPPPPPMSTADDAAAYQGSPYPPEHFSSPADNQPSIQAPPPPQAPQPQQSHPGDPGAGNKQYDEEGSGEFGGLVSYFSSQREDDLDS